MTQVEEAPKHLSAKLAGPALATFSSQIVVAVLSLVHIIVVARSLGAAGRGDVVFLTTLAGLAGFVSTISAHDGLANQIGSKRHDRRVLASNALILAAVFGTIGATAIYLIIASSSFLAIDVDLTALAFAAVAVPGFVLMTYATALVRANHAFNVANVSLISVTVWVFSIDAVLAATGQISVRRVVAVWAIGQFIGCVPLLRYIRRHFGFGRPDLGLARLAVGFGMKAHGAGLLNTGTYRIDQWLLGAIAGPGPLGIYSVAVAWYEGLFLLPSACAAVARPSVVEASDDEAGSIAETALRLSLVGTIIAAIGLFLAAPVLCVWIFGDEFGPATNQLRILVIGAFGVGLLKVLGSSLTARGRPGLEAAGVAVGASIGLLLYLVLIPRFGGTGAAIASTVAYLTAGGAVAVVFIRTMGSGVGAFIPRSDDLAGLRSLVAGGGKKEETWRR